MASAVDSVTLSDTGDISSVEQKPNEPNTLSCGTQFMTDKPFSKLYQILSFIVIVKKVEDMRMISDLAGMPKDLARHHCKGGVSYLAHKPTPSVLANTYTL